MYGFVALLTKAVFTQVGIFLSTVSETRNISAQVVSLPLVFLKSGFLSYCLIVFVLGWQQGFFFYVWEVGCWLGGEAHW